MELSIDQKLQIFCSALTGILSVATTNTILTGDPAAHAFRIANRSIMLLEERGLAGVSPFAQMAPERRGAKSESTQSGAIREPDKLEFDD